MLVVNLSAPRDRDDSGFLEARMSFEAATNLKAVQTWKPQIQEDEFRKHLVREGHGGIAIDGKFHHVPHAAQEKNHAMGAVEAVFDDQDSSGSASLRNIVKSVGLDPLRLRLSGDRQQLSLGK